MPIPSLLKPRIQISKGRDAPPAAEQPSRLPQSQDAVARCSNAIPIDHPPTRLPQTSSIPHHVVDGAKRLSFLPQRGEWKAPATNNGLGTVAISERNESEQPPGELVYPMGNPSASSNVQQAIIQDQYQARPRPQSMYQTGPASGNPPADGGIRALHTIRVPEVTRRSEKKASSSQSTGLGRSQSLRKPGLPPQSAQPTHPRGITRNQTMTTTTAAQKESTSRNHSRTLSSTATGTRKESFQPRAQSERPRSMYVAPTQRANTVSDHSSQTTRSSARIAALKRPASSKSKPEAADGSDSASTNDTDLQPLTNYGRRREPLQEDPKKAPRPAFSTLQQHFTPRKAAKAPTSTFLHPAVPDPSAYSLPPEILCLQAELLQLHLLHEASIYTTRRWELSAKRMLHGKFDEVASLYQVMRDNERQGQEQKNLQALREWSHGKPSSGLIEHIQLLSAPLQELPSLVDSGGRFTRLVDDFTRWIAWVEDIRAAREDAVTEQGGDSGCAEGLGDFWKAENAALTRKLTSFLSNLDRLTQPASGSSIADVVSACKELLAGVLEELRTMLSIEKSVVAKEKDWVEKRLQDIAQDIGAHLAQNNEGAEAWRK